MGITAIYARISQDDAGVRGLGVERQITDCRELAARKGWDGLETYVDNDVSASNAKKPRPSYSRLLADIERGKVTALVVYDLDRLHRRPVELEAFIDLADKRKLALASVGGDADLATAQGQFVARVKGAAGRHEADQMSRRIRRKVEELAAAGKPFNGGMRPFGYDQARLHVVESEAELIREAATRVLGGASLRSVTKDWNARGILSVMGKPWSVQSLKNNLTAPRMAGLITHKGAVVGPAQWPAILDLTTHEALRHLLLSPGRSTSVAMGRPRKYWFTGLVRCGRCGSRMGVSGGKPRAVRCLIDYGGCGRVGVQVRLFEPVARAAVLRYAARALQPKDSTADAERGALLDTAIEAAEARLESLADAFADDEEGDAIEYRAASRAVRRRVDALRAERAEITVATAVERPLIDVTHLGADYEDYLAVGLYTAEPQPDPAALGDQFDALEVEEQEAVARKVVSRIIVDPVTKRGSTFNPGRIRAEYALFSPPAPVE